MIKLNYPVILSHWCSTTVSLENYPLYSSIFLPDVTKFSQQVSYHMRAKFKKNLNLFKTQSETQEGCMQGIYKRDSKWRRIFPLFLWVRTRKSQSQKETYFLIFVHFQVLVHNENSRFWTGSHQPVWSYTGQLCDAFS